MKRFFGLFCLWLATILSVPAAGLIIIHEPGWWPGPPPPNWPRPPRPMPPPVWAPLEVTFTKVTASIKEQVATTTVEQEFYNPNARQLEGTFLFPVPKGAHINKFTMEINGKTAEAELLTADKARKIYEDIVRSLRDPALLEYSDRDLFKVRVFPIEPNSKKHITLSYGQVLKADSGVVNFTFPLNTEKFSAKPLKNLAVKIDLQTKRPLKSIYSPTHKVEIKRNGERQATIGFEDRDVKPDTDFQLLYAEEAGDLGVSLLTHKTSGDDGFFLLLASPGEVKQKQTVPKDVAFVLDSSGSMAGAKLEQAKKALLFCVENLNDVDRFEILRFSTEVEPLFDKLTEATKDSRSRAEKFIKDVKPIGGTAIDDALRKAIALRPDKSERPYVVIFLTDGRPTVGNTEENQIVDAAVKSAQGNTRIFCFGIGTDVNTHLLDKITEGTRAASQYVLPEEDIEVKVSSFFTKIKEPVLANLKLGFPSGVRASKMYPAPLPDLFKGEQLIVAGRYSGQTDGDLLLEGTVNGEKRAFEFKVNFPDAGTDHEFIPRLWATRRVGYLLDEIRLHGENKELKDEVVDLARKYGIVTPYTAYLIVEDEQRRSLAQDVRTFRQLEENQPAMNASKAVADSFRRENSGGSAVAGARSYYSLKSADVPQNATANGSFEALRAAPASAPSAMGWSGGRSYGGSRAAVSGPAPSTAALAKEYSQQGRFVNGHTFYQNGEQWIDSEVQKKTAAKRVRVEFGSEDYFNLLKKNPSAASWMSLGRSVQFVLDDIIYEITDPVPGAPANN